MQIIRRTNKSNEALLSQATAHLVRIHIEYWAGKDAERLKETLKHLVFQIGYHLHQEQCEALQPDQYGILIGSLLAGTLNHCQHIKSVDEKRQWMVNSASNLIWAASTYLAMAPWFAGNVAAAIIGTIDVAVVGAAVAYNYFRSPRDYSPIVKTIEGQIEISALRSETAKHEDITRMLEFMRATIHLNGLSD